jgi:Asp-tRNA(Asn)/Glu-tRNA(Gln) amidotransferase A subunit family amidase
VPPLFDKLPAAQDTIMHAEGLPHFLAEYVSNHHLLHKDFRDRVENSRAITPDQIVAAQDLAAEGRRAFDAFFRADLDVVVSPAALGEAPVATDPVGAWIMNVMWTLLHVPCVSVPVTTGPAGLPVGIQLIGPRFGDPRLLTIAGLLAPVLTPAR